MMLDADDSQLVLVDYQDKLMPAMFEGAHVIANAVKLAQIANLMQVPVWATEQYPAGLGHTVEALQPFCTKTISKMSFSAVQDGLLDVLRPPVRKQGGNARSLPKHLQKPQVQPELERPSIVVAGCEAHICMLQTALELLENEMEVWVVTDACGSRSELNRDAAFDRLAGAGAELVTTEMVVFEWLRSSEHPAFRQIQNLIK